MQLVGCVWILWLLESRKNTIIIGIDGIEYVSKQNVFYNNNNNY